MLQLKPNCEYCDKDLSSESTETYICSYECTFCADCVGGILQNVCPNCGGGFVPRPIRPKTARRTGISIADQPASIKRVNTKFSREDILSFSDATKDITPENR